jgi:hypothetical protein
MFKKPSISILTGAIASIIAYLIITIATALPFTATIAICLGALSLYLSIVLLNYHKAATHSDLNRLNSFDLAGLSNVFIVKKPMLTQYLNEVENSFYFWGISAKRTTSTPELQQKLIEIGRKNGDIRFLLFNPKGPELKCKAEDEGDDWRSWEKEISATIQRLKSIAKNNGIDIKIRVFDEFPVWRMTILDCKRIYLQYFLSGKQGPQSPLFVIDGKLDSLFWPFFLEFKKVWENRSMEV